MANVDGGGAAAVVATRSDCEVLDCALIGMPSSNGLFAGGNSTDLMSTGVVSSPRN